MYVKKVVDADLEEYKKEVKRRTVLHPLGSMDHPLGSMDLAGAMARRDGSHNGPISDAGASTGDGTIQRLNDIERRLDGVGGQNR